MQLTDEPTKGVIEYVAMSLAESRVDAARRKAREGMLQRVQLEGGVIIDEADGIASARVPCPACSPDKPQAAYAALRGELDVVRATWLDALWEGSGTIEVETPCGLQVTERVAPMEVDVTKLSDETLRWAITHGVFTLKVESDVLRSFDLAKDTEVLTMLPRVGAALSRGEPVQVLRKMTEKQIKAES